MEAILDFTKPFDYNLFDNLLGILFDSTNPQVYLII